MKLRLLVILFSLFSVQTFAQSQCADLFSGRSIERKDLVEMSLAKYSEIEMRDKSAEDIMMMNAKTLAAIEAEIPLGSATKKSQISYETAEMLRQQINENPIVRPMNDKYSQPDVSIGYCFGRATFVHLMLLKMGVQKSSIQKIWAVGSMKAGGISWQFHVATMAYSAKDGWLVIDSNHSHPMRVADWMKYYYSQSGDGRVRFYATDAQKFTFELGKYSRVQLGLDLARSKDWYKHYFKDMLVWMKDKKVTEYGVTTIKVETKPEEKSLNQTIKDMWRSIIEFVR